MRPVLIGYDGSPQGRDAVALGLKLAVLFEAPVEVALVYPVEGRAAHSYDDAVRAAAEEQLAEARALLDMDAPVHAVGATSPARGLHETAESCRAQLLVVGSSHRGTLGRAVAGSVAKRLLHGAPCAVAVAPRGFAERGTDAAAERIVLAHDETPEAEIALRAAERLAHRGHLPIELVRVAPTGVAAAATWPLYPVPTIPESDTADEVGGELAKVETTIEEPIPTSHAVLRGPNAAHALVEHVESDDLLVLGSRAYGPAKSVLLGSVSRAVVANCAAPVLVLPRAAAGSPRRPGADESASMLSTT
jgi:nucleotide-binding universal stress UspA family protein